MPISLPRVRREPGINFPDGFRFGVADADLQVIGEEHTIAEEGSQPTMWLRFTQERGMATPGPGIDRFHRWQEDLEHLRRLGVRHYRTSVSMARTLTEDGGLNQKAIEWYRRYFGALKESGIAVYATVHHWELPQSLNERGGWTNRETVSALQSHAGVIAEQLGPLIDEYFLMNEPWCSSMLSYYEGMHAPGRQHESDRENLKTAVRASHHVLLAQGLAFAAIKERVPDARIVSVLNFQPAYTISTSQEDMEAARINDGYYNAWFLDATYLGRYPEEMVRLYGEGALPSGYERDIDAIKIGDKLYAQGVNYYRGALYRGAGGELESEEVILDGGSVNGLDWPVFRPPDYPEAMYDLLQQVYFGYRSFGLKRIYVTENGMALATPWDGMAETIDDEPRVQYLREHLEQVHKALLHGIPVEAYFVWTLMDNFEWAEGYEPGSAFGLIHVERPSMTRVWKKSAGWYGEVARTGRMRET